MAKASNSAMQPWVHLVSRGLAEMGMEERKENGEDLHNHDIILPEPNRKNTWNFMLGSRTTFLLNKRPIFRGKVLVSGRVD